MSDDFDFDYWKNLFTKSEKEFNEARLAILEQSIQRHYPNDPDQQQRMRGRIHRMDVTLNKVKNPIVRFAVLQTEFWKQFDQFNDALRKLKEITQGDSKSESTVIPFPHKK